MAALVDDAYRAASLRFIGNRFVDPNVVFPSRGNIDRSRRRLADLKTFVSTIVDNRMKEACEMWVKYGESQLLCAETALATANLAKEILRDAGNAQGASRPA